MHLFLPDVERCFDAAHYLDQYPDVRRSGMPPLAHFLLYGAREGRRPNPWFDARYYLAANPDVAAAGANPLLHYLRFGWKEGRGPNALFDAAFYESRYPQRRYPKPFVDYVVRRKHGESPVSHLPFSLPSESYQVATKQISERHLQCAVDIIIPVHSGLPETRRCLESVLGAPCLTPHQIIVINDQSPDPALTQYLRDRAASSPFTLIENPQNLGFAASANRGLTLHPQHDVVLLNNDTEVANDWLDRLAAAAYAGPQTGTVTPFSNHATICTYPQGDTPTADLDAIFRQVNAGHRVDIPTAVGFCMYIRRDCLNHVGTFRPEIFGKGYGEENDFCLRAIYKGWGHVLAADVFVYHAGETSFGSEAEARRQAGVQAVQRLYPEYSRLIATHQRNDPAKPYRVAVSAWRMRHSGKPVILVVSHGLGGGVQQYVDELRQILTPRAEMLLLTPAGCGAVMLRNLAPADDFRVAFEAGPDYPQLLDLLRHCGVSRMHVQHTLGIPLDLLQLRQDLNVPMDFSLHDYFILCPQVTLTDPAGRYCGEPDAAGCNACIALRPVRRGHGGPCVDIAAWREKYAPLVTHADRVIAPSSDAAARFRRYFPQARIVTAPHPSRSALLDPAPSPLAPDQPLVIAVLGTMTPHKGIHRLRAVADAAYRQKLPLRFVLAGSVVPPLLAADSGAAESFSQTGPYTNDQLPGLLQTAGAHIVWFPPQWPETFSYTLSAALEMALPVIAPHIGAFAERLAGRSWTWVVPWDWDHRRLLEFFVSLRRDHFLTGVPPAPPAAPATPSPDFYPLQYLFPQGGETV